MHIELLSILITALVNFILATYVLFKNSRRIINISFGFFAYSAGLWSLALFIIGSAKDPTMLKFAGHVSWFAGAMMACNFLLFAYVFPETRDEFPPIRMFLRIYVPGALAAVLAFTPLVMIGIRDVGTGVRPVYGKGILLYVLYCLAFTGYGLFLLARKYLRHPGRFERVQLKYMFWGLLVSISGVVVMALLLPLAGISRYSTPLTPLVTLVAVTSISYAIVRHRLMDLGVVFRNALIYASVALTIGIVLVGSILLLDSFLGLSTRANVFLAAAFAAILVQPVRGWVELPIDRYFFRGRYDYKAALTEFSSSMTRILDLEDLQNRIVHEVAAMLQVKTAALLLPDPDEKRFTVRASLPVSLGESDGGVPADSAIVEKLGKEHSLCVKDEFRRTLPYPDFAPFEKEFDRMEAEVFIPLIYRGELIGLLTLGEKKLTDIYSNEDLNLLATLGNQVAVALENALLHHTVIMLKNHNENILRYMSSGVIAIDRRGIINTFNDKAQEILRLSSQGVINQKTDMLPAVLRAMLTDTISGHGRYSNREVQILSETGSILHLSASTSLIKDEKNEVTGALLVFNDLTEMKVLEGEMWRADKLASLGTLAAGMAHEIKNPLVSIKTFAQLLPTKYEDKEFRDIFSTITVEEVERINSIVEKLLEFARPSAPLFESIDVIEIVEEVLLLLSTEITKHHVTVNKKFEVASAPIIGDKSQLKQALLNLCLNSLQAIDAVKDRDGGELTIAVGFRKSRYRNIEGLGHAQLAHMIYGADIAASAEDAEILLIKVRDSGRGISRKDLGRIFDPFFTTKEKGLGLGLAVVHGIIEEHSGNITVESSENIGTEFVISLPVTQIFAKERV
ncbi:MAG: GAF domain-containing protein [Candidatus Abyssobacteria bacterium SURF_17]|uniref:histidine kinase n=1 Tax=Candidatus Abyssobacteria bacterium SURF_17 TaxID=2093361 RepID=A0A419F9J1_9BACT|nr:MAG: GAF domain-containing protein [Candidatus Abyssubacteria bacterium SURF_17]